MPSHRQKLIRQLEQSEGLVANIERYWLEALNDYKQNVSIEDVITDYDNNDIQGPKYAYAKGVIATYQVLRALDALEDFIDETLSYIKTL